MKNNVFPTLEKFKEYVEDDKGIKFTSSNNSILKYIVNYFAEKDFTRDNFKLLIKELIIVKKFKKDTVKRYIIVGKKITEYLHSDILLGYNGPRIENPEPSGTLGDLISDEEMEGICNCDLPRKKLSPQQERLKNIQFKAIFTLMRFTGISPEDLSRLTWDMDKVTHFEFSRIKTGEPVIAPIVPQLRALLDLLPRTPGNFVFLSPTGTKYGKSGQAFRDEIKKRCTVLGINKWVTNLSFRYSMITWCYINAGETHIPKLTKITGHTMNTAVKHYAKFNINVLMDALYATHPGLRQSQSIDSIKRVIISLISKLVDMSKFEIKLEITPKKENKRIIHLS